MTERRVKLWRETKRNMEEWFYERYPFLKPYRRWIVLVGRSDNDTFTHMVINHKRDNPRGTKSVFVSISKVEDRAYMVTGWAFGDNIHWRRGRGRNGPIDMIADSAQYKRDQLHLIEQRFKEIESKVGL